MMNRRMFAAGVLACCAAASVQAQNQSGDTLSAYGAWARPTVAGQMAGGAFLTIRNAGRGTDRLLGASSQIAEAVELHSMAMQGEVMTMRAVEGIDIPPGQTTQLHPGGLHLMFMGVKSPLTVGSRFPLTLRFRNAGQVTVQVTVQVAADATSVVVKAQPAAASAP